MNDLFNKIHYFDYAATTFQCSQSLAAYNYFQNNVGILWGKGNNILSQTSKEIFESSLMVLREHFSIPDNYKMIIGKNTTEVINVIAYSLRTYIHPMDIILVGPYEHHSNYLPWKYLAKEKNAIFLEMTLCDDGSINMDYLDSIKDNVKIVAYSSISNTNAYKMNEKIITSIFPNALIFSDESQKVAHEELYISNQKAGYVLSSHKMYGPKNIAGAFIRNDVIENMEPVMLGGGMIEYQQLYDKWNSEQYKFYAGTYDVGLLYAWSEACKYIQTISYNVIEKKESDYYDCLSYTLSQKEHIRIINNSYSSKGLISFYHNNIHPHDVESLLAKHNIIIRSGNMCAQPAIRKIGYNAINRISFGMGINKNSFSKLIDIINEVL